MLPKISAALGLVVLVGACAETRESINPADISNQNYNSGKFDDGSSTYRGDGTGAGTSGLGFSAPLCNRRSLILIAGNRYCPKN